MKVSWTHKSSTAPMGRFGGGWQWNVGVQAGRLSRERGTVIVNLFIGYARFSWGGRQPDDVVS